MFAQETRRGSGSRGECLEIKSVDDESKICVCADLSRKTTWFWTNIDPWEEATGAAQLV